MIHDVNYTEDGVQQAMGVIGSDSLGGPYDQRPPFPPQYYNSRHYAGGENYSEWISPSIGDPDNPFEQFDLPQYSGGSPPFVAPSSWPPVQGRTRGVVHDVNYTEDGIQQAMGVVQTDAWDVMGPVAHTWHPFPSPSDVAGGRFFAAGHRP